MFPILKKLVNLINRPKLDITYNDNILTINSDKPITIKFGNNINILSEYDLNINSKNINIDSAIKYDKEEVLKLLLDNPDFNIDQFFKLYGGKLTLNSLQTPMFKHEEWVKELYLRQEEMIKKLHIHIEEIADKKLPYLESLTSKEIN